MKKLVMRLSLLVLLCSPGAVLAQEAEQPALIQFLQQTMDWHVPEIILLALSFLVVSLIVERMATLVFGADRIISGAVLRWVCQQTREGTITPAQKQEVLSLCLANPSSFSSAVAQCVQRAGRSLGEIETACSHVLSVEHGQIGRSTGYLQLVGRLAPFIGLLGTVIGVMAAFFENASGSQVGHSLLARGISSALGTTAGGILITVLAVALGHLFRQRQNRMFDSMVLTLMPFLPILADSRSGSPGRG